MVKIIFKIRDLEYVILYIFDFMKYVYDYLVFCLKWNNGIII